MRQALSSAHAMPGNGGGSHGMPANRHSSKKAAARARSNGERQPPLSRLGPAARGPPQSTISEVSWRCSGTAPASVTSTVCPRVMAWPLSEFIRMMWMKNAMPGAISAGLPV